MLLAVFPIEAQQGRVIRVIVITSKSGASKERGVNVEFNSFMQYSPKMDVAYLNPYASSAARGTGLLTLLPIICQRVVFLIRAGAT